MWIIPKSLPLLASAQDTAESSWGLEEQASALARSLFARTKPLRSQILLRKWKQGSWIRLLFGRTSKHLIPPHLLDAWISSLPDIRAKDSVTPASAKELKMLASYGLSSCGQLSLFAPGEFFSKTSKAISASDCAKSLETWKRQVIEQRGEYSARLKSALRISASGCSSSESRRTPNVLSENAARGCGQDPEKRKAQGRQVNLQDQVTQWPTPDVPNGGRALAPETTSTGRKPDGTKAQVGLQNAVNLWPTPKALTGGPNSNRENRSQTGGPDLQEAVQQWKTPHGFCGMEQDGSYGGGGEFAKQVKAWSTPRSSDGEKGSPNQRDSSGSQPLPAQVVSAWPTPSAHDAKGANSEAHMTKDRPHLGQLPNAVIHQTAGQPAPANPNTNGNRPASCQLNPDWVETLMGVPIGWTDLGCSETVSYRPAQTELGLCSTRG
jgi:hypothetical protein